MFFFLGCEGVVFFRISGFRFYNANKWEHTQLCLQIEKLWELLCPLLRTALSNITIETYADWGTCIATACVSFLFIYFHSFIHTFKAKLLLVILLSQWLLFPAFTGEQRPTQASLAVWDANGVSSQWRGGVLCRCLVSRKVAALSRCWGDWQTLILLHFSSAVVCMCYREA